MSKVSKKLDILLSVRAPVGSLNIAIEPCCIWRGVASIRSELYGNNFIFYMLKSFKLDRYESGTVFSSIKKSDIENHKVITNKRYPITKLISGEIRLDN